MKFVVSQNIRYGENAACAAGAHFPYIFVNFCFLCSFLVYVIYCTEYRVQNLGFRV